MPEPRAVEARIAEVLREHVLGDCQDHSKPSDPIPRWTRKCLALGCEWYGNAGYADHLAEVVAGALAPDIDKLAEAIWYEDRPHWASPKHWAWTDVSDPHKGVYRRMARAAVAAMGWHPEARP